MTNKPKVKRYDDMGCPEQICRVDTMCESDDGDYVLYEDYEALQDNYQRLQAECERLRNTLSQVATAVGGYADPSCSLEFMEEIPKEVESVVQRLVQDLAESRANDQQAMYYLNQVREVVGGYDFPDMVERCRELVK